MGKAQKEQLGQEPALPPREPDLDTESLGDRSHIGLGHRPIHEGFGAGRPVDQVMPEHQPLARHAEFDEMQDARQRARFNGKEDRRLKCDAWGRQRSPCVIEEIRPPETGVSGAPLTP